MKNLTSTAIKIENGKLLLLDQQLLPHKEEWIEITGPEEMIAAIESLKTRGAPLIGVAAALALAKLAETGCSEQEFRDWAKKLRASRPTAVNLMWAIDELLNFESDFNLDEIVYKAEKIFNEDVELCALIGENGAGLISDGDNILTHCNTGGLATAGVGTALGVIQKSFEQGKKIHVFVDETRPLLQGGRLTTWELQKLGIPYTLICDNMAAQLMSQGRVQKIIVGADRIATNGDFANKIGTYGLAVNAFYHRVPLFVAAPYTTVDKNCHQGQDIPIEQRPSLEVKGVTGAFGSVQWAPDQGEVYNPAFDVTPHEMVSAWILDKGVFSIEDVKAGKLK